MIKIEARYDLCHMCVAGVRTKPKVRFVKMQKIAPIKKLRMIDELIKCLEKDYERIRVRSFERGLK